MIFGHILKQKKKMKIKKRRIKMKKIIKDKIIKDIKTLFE